MATSVVSVPRDTERMRAINARRRRTKLYRSRRRAGLIFALPAFVFVGLLLVVPIGQAIYYSMTNWNGITSQWIGPSTYTQVLASSTFWRVLQNNGLLLLSIPFAIVIPLAIAFLLNERVWGWRFFRSVYFLPTAVSWVVIGMVADNVFGSGGQVNTLLGALGLGALKANWLGGETTALIAVAVTFVWSMIGINTVIFMTGMAALDPTLHEAARVDGASAWRVFWRITLPQLRRFIQFATVLSVISAFTNLFSLIFVMTGGGPGFGTTTLEFFIYQNAFAQSQFGTAAMLGLILLVIMVAIGIVQLKLLSATDD